MGWLLNYNEGKKRRSLAAQQQKKHSGTAALLWRRIDAITSYRQNNFKATWSIVHKNSRGWGFSMWQYLTSAGLVHRDQLHRFFSCQMWAIPAFSWGLRSIHQVIRVVGLCLALPTTTRPVITWWGIHTACVSCLQHQHRERKQQVAGSPCGWLEFRKKCYDVEIVYIVIGYWHWTLDSQFIANVAYHFQD